MNIPKEALDILEAVQGQSFIAGGYARWVATGFKSYTPSDIDLFHYKQNMQYNPVDKDEFELHDQTVTALMELGYHITRDLPNAIEMKMSALQECREKEYFSIANHQLRDIIYRSGDFKSWYRLLPVAGYTTVQVIKPFTNYIPAFTEPEIKGGHSDFTFKEVQHERRLAMKTFGTPSEVISLFDFPQAMVALEWRDWQRPHSGISNIIVTTDERFDAAEASHKLSINHINCPIAVAMRAFKYVGKGYTIRPREIVKLFKDWDNRPPDYKKRLTDLCEKDNLEAAEWFELEQLLRID